MYAITAQHPISCVGRVLQIWLFAWNLNVVLGEKWNSVDHKGLMYSVRSSLIPYYTIKGGYETLNQQWMYLIAAQQPILCADSRTMKIWYSTWHLRDLMTRSGPRWACVCYYMLLQPSSYIWGRLGITQSAMDVSYYSTSSHLVCSEPKIWYFAWNLKVVLGRNDTMWTIRGLCMLIEAPSSILINMRKTIIHLHSNGCLYLQHSIPFPVLRGCPKSDILHDIWEIFWGEMIGCGP